MTNWSPQQDRALSAVSGWLEDPGDKQIFRLFGYAGTGKTTMARHLAGGVSGGVIFAAYTGKAASVLRASGAPDARTLHSLIYIPKERSRTQLLALQKTLSEVDQMIKEAGDPQPSHLVERRAKMMKLVEAEERSASRPAFDLNLESDLRGASLLVVDECSMVDDAMASDILSFGVPVLVLGDPAQLPPVSGEGAFTNARPDIMLTEIHRQARDNPIIDLATRIRSGDPLPLGRYGDSEVTERTGPERAIAADQILVGLNRTRVSTNARVRQLRHLDADPYPGDGEKLVCLRNDKEFGFLNGTLHIQKGPSTLAGGYVNLNIVPEDSPEGLPVLVPAHPEWFKGDPKDIGYWDRKNAQEFTFGYALTCHKAQGSQWSDVLVIDESESFRQADTSRRWLYTAVTRAKERVTVVRRR